MDLHRVNKPRADNIHTVHQTLGKVREHESGSGRDILEMKAIAELVGYQGRIPLLERLEE